MKKKFLRNLVAAAAVVCMGVSLLGGCGSSSNESGTTDTEGGGSSTVDDTELASAADSTGDDTSDLTAIEVAKLMGNGINLGNTLESYGHSTLGTDADATDYETLWGAPETTQEMIQSMKDAGFDTLRVPVAWTNAMDFEDGDYTIKDTYLDRVEQIIDWALTADMYVIVNDHWDGGWWGMFGSASEETRDAAMDLYVSMWTQIAERYADYSDKLIFESGNEEIGYRLNDTDIAEDSGTLSDDECFEVANEINQTFVDTVRATGGNNATRFLLIAGFGTDITNTCDDRFEMPTDTATDKLLISVHYYDPSGYCQFGSIASWGSKGDYEDMNEMLEKMTKFTDQGYGVVIGEYGVLSDSHELIDDTIEYTTNLLDNCDVYGYCPVLWDTGNAYDREGGGFYDSDYAQLYQDRSNSARADMSEEEIVAAAQQEMDSALENAEEGGGVSDDTALAWIMYTSSDWSVSYSVGDTYDPDSATAGIVATDVEITGEGTYTVSLDFTGVSGGYASGTTFCAVGIANGETLFPGYTMTIDEVDINGEAITLTGTPYTTSDDSICTRVNLYNAWVSKIPDEARTADGDLSNATPTPLDADSLGNVETISVTFTYAPAN